MSDILLRFVLVIFSRLLRQVDVELFEIMPKLQILLHKEDMTFNNNNKQKRLSFLNIISRAPPF